MRFLGYYWLRGRLVEAIGRFAMGRFAIGRADGAIGYGL